MGREWPISPTKISQNHSPTSPANGDLIQAVPFPLKIVICSKNSVSEHYQHFSLITKSNFQLSMENFF